MESSTSLFNLYRHDGVHTPTSSTSDTTQSIGMKKSASQAYFDRYPERKGKGPYIPSPKLTTSMESDISMERNSERNEAQQLTSSVKVNKENSSKIENTAAAIRPEKSLAGRDSEKHRQVKKVASSKAAEKQDESAASTTPALPSTSYVSTFFSGTSPSHAPPRQFANAKMHVAVAAASRSPSGYPIPHNSFHRRFSQRDPNLVSVPLISQDRVEDGQVSESKVTQVPIDTPRRRLKAQQSMPNVRIAKEDKKIPDLPDMSQKPRPVASSSNKKYLGHHPKARGNGSPFSQTSSSNISSIDDIVRQNTPDIIIARSLSSKSDVFTQSLGRRSMPRKDIAVYKEGEESDSSLDSIEKEIQHSMRMTKSSDEVASRSILLNSSEGDQSSTTSPSTSAFFGKKKATSSIFNPTRRLHRLSNATSSSPGPSDSSPNHNRRLSKKFPNLSLPSTSVPPSPVHSPSPQSPLPSSIQDQDDEIRNYLGSKKLTTLMTLSRLPFQGLTVSFADVGDPEGHPVFVFLGLGAVRYLVGLYDEMATVLHLRLICIDRWGLGKTDDLSAEKRGVLEWSNVVIEVADRLQIDRFSLLAHSAGAPYAMATCLVHENRIAGPVHLLAPWVGSTVESGYKWLKYVPDGVIKTAQAADWRMQAWKLGLGKSPLLVYSDETNHNTSQEDSTASRDTCSPSTSQKSFDGTLLTPRMKQISLRKSRSGLLNVDNTSSNLDTSTWPIITESESSSLYGAYNSGNSDQSVSPTPHQAVLNGASTLPPSRPTSSRSPDPQFKTLSNASSQRPQFERSSSAPWITDSEINQVPSYSVSELTTALMRASHAESLRGGATNDLLVILERSSQKPWGFSYTDIIHTVIVWQGDKDERISLSSIMWMEREMKNCCVNLVKNANHGLMTNVAVVIEALESISTHS